MPDLFTEYGAARLTGRVVDRDPDVDSDSAAVALTITRDVTIHLDAAEARNMASALIGYADEVDRQNGAAAP